MAVDPQVQTIIDGMSTTEVQEFAELGHVAVREMCETMLLPFEVDGNLQVSDQQIPVNNTQLPVRVYQPQSKQALPLLAYFHGGGWTIGSLNTHDPICRALSLWSGTVVVSVDYRLAPEFPFPTPLEDCFAATCWLAENAAQYNADGAQLIVAGDSAGGNLATEVCLLARDRAKELPLPLTIQHQLLFYPIVDCNFDTNSYKENAEGYVLRRSDMQWFWDQYIADPEKRNNSNATPLHADLADLPPATVITAQYDTLRDEGNAYAEKLKQAGVDVWHQELPGMIHGFIGFAALVDKGKEVLKECSERVKINFSS